ncbi:MULTISPECIES: PDDEXK nuclease domain-containing protein [unclassified Streptomyces]|uniref:PDDEXK nuclease domain-containing protein n=1 Tax=unclassified Streptomyces TaxID=2593676 RepID=UPI00081B5D74|nr:MULTISPECIES: PDDEXK nuclease domain-containing protein [unclassified Streptomyces]SCD70064.1 Protein of unknown function [Streptomyces sp. DvalAA-43]
MAHICGRHTERDLEDALVAHLIRFLTEPGVGFAFVGRQYPVVVGDSEYRIDLLFYHCKLHCYRDSFAVHRPSGRW